MEARKASLTKGLRTDFQSNYCQAVGLGKTSLSAPQFPPELCKGAALDPMGLSRSGAVFLEP
jgi:hypothetical protein